MKAKLVNTSSIDGPVVEFKKPLNLIELQNKYEGRLMTKDIFDQIKGDIAYFDMKIQAGFPLCEWEKKAHGYLVKLQSIALACLLGSAGSSKGEGK